MLHKYSKGTDRTACLKTSMAVDACEQAPSALDASRRLFETRTGLAVRTRGL